MSAEPNFNGLYPVFIYEQDMVLPQQGTYYIVAGNGIWLHKDTGVVGALIQVKTVSILDDLKAETFVTCNLPKIPEKHILKIKEFFRQVVEEYHSESEINLYYSKEKNDFKIHVPHQTVSHGGVHYTRSALTHIEEMSDYLRVGTIHSHCDFGAFHSGTDVDDEQDFDGLHVTFGHNDKAEFTISASVVVNGNRTKINPLNVLEGINHLNNDYYSLTSNDLEPEWLEQINCWMKMVSSRSGSPPKSECQDFAQNDKIVWEKDLPSSMEDIRKTIGDGPFAVKNCSDGLVTINTIAGLARFCDKFFKKEVE